MDGTTGYRGELLDRLTPVTGPGAARRMLRQAAQIAGIPDEAIANDDDLLRVCAALSAEGGRVQQIAEEMARAALHSEPPH